MKLNRIFGFCSILLCLFLLLISPLSAFAAKAEGSGSLTVSFLIENKAVGDAAFHVYRVADEDKQPVGAYAAYEAEFKDLSSDKVVSTAATLAAYTERDGIPAAYTDVTNEYGYVHFEELEKGVYLVVGEAYREGDIGYTPLPFLVSVPSYDTDGKPLYDITASPKYDKWQIDDSQLETTPETPSEAPSETPAETTSEVPADVAPSDNNDTTLPQTGQLWWPVPILLFMGVLMLSIGIFISRKSDHHTDV